MKTCMLIIEGSSAERSCAVMDAARAYASAVAAEKSARGRAKTAASLVTADALAILAKSASMVLR